jgi:hypothetical protein
MESEGDGIGKKMGFLRVPFPRAVHGPGVADPAGATVCNFV